MQSRAKLTRVNGTCGAGGWSARAPARGRSRKGRETGFSFSKGSAARPVIMPTSYFRWLQEQQALNVSRESPRRVHQLGEIISTYEFADLLELLPGHPDAAAAAAGLVAYQGFLFAQPFTETSLSHAKLYDFISNEFDLAQFGIQKGDSCAILMPTVSPENAVCVLATAAYCCCAPLNPKGTVEELKYELESTKAKGIILLSGDDGDDTAAGKAARELGGSCKIITLRPRLAAPGLFDLSGDKMGKRQARGSQTEARPELNGPEDVGLILHTSGTVGAKKRVAYTLRTLVTGSGCIISSWGLSPTDCALIMMPLFHVGGVCRNVFAVVLSGGSFSCSSLEYLSDSESPHHFWNLCKRVPVTWYYGGPSFHMQILANKSTGKDESDEGLQIRMVGNAAGGLPPQTAKEMQEAFSSGDRMAVILPSYGMTECMPISSPPLDYQLDRPGTSGTPCGPAVRISSAGPKVCGVGEAGHVCIKGPPLFAGYEGKGKQDSGFSNDGWFDTGDMGHLDADGYLFITGRSKEIINRGGEVLSPLEIEQEITKHPNVKEVVAFAAKHTMLGETVGVAVVLQPSSEAGKFQLSAADGDQKCLAVLRRWIHHTEVLGMNKIPDVIRVVDQIERNAAGKVSRNGYAEKLGIEELGAAAAAVAELDPELLGGLDIGGQVVQILKSSIGLYDVELEDTMAGLGIDSLGRLRLYAALKSAFGSDRVSSQALADGGMTVEELIRKLSSGAGADGGGGGGGGGGYLDAVGGLRFLSILCVISDHAQQLTSVLPPFLAARQASGVMKLNMTFLFILSGYENGATYSNANSKAWRQFFVGRISFLFPLYWALNLVMIPFSFPMYGTVWNIIFTIVAHFFAVQSLFPVVVQNAMATDHLWYLSTIWILTWSAPLLMQLVAALNLKSAWRIVLMLLCLMAGFPLWSVFTLVMGHFGALNAISASGCALTYYVNGTEILHSYNDWASVKASVGNSTSFQDYENEVQTLDQSTFQLPGLAGGPYFLTNVIWWWWAYPLGRLCTFAVGFVMARVVKEYDGAGRRFVEDHGHVVVDVAFLLACFFTLFIPVTSPLDYPLTCGWHLYLTDETIIEDTGVHAVAGEVPFCMNYWYDPGIQAELGTWPTVLLCVWLYASNVSKKSAMVNTWFFSSRLLAWLGTFSFEIYLVHLPLIVLVLDITNVENDAFVDTDAPFLCAETFAKWSYLTFWLVLGLLIVPVAYAGHCVASHYRQATTRWADGVVALLETAGAAAVRLCGPGRGAAAARSSPSASTTRSSDPLSISRDSFAPAGSAPRESFAAAAAAAPLEASSEADSVVAGARGKQMAMWAPLVLQFFIAAVPVVALAAGVNNYELGASIYGTLYDVDEWPMATNPM